MWLGTLDGPGPMYRRLYRAIRRAILDGRIRPGERLPSTRWVANDSGVARNRVILAYSQLLDEGYVVGRIGSGTYVVPELPSDFVAGSESAQRSTPPEPPRLSRFARRVQTQDLDWAPEDSPTYDFRYARPSLRDFPYSTWRRLLAQQVSTLEPRNLEYSYGPGAAAGLPLLRSTIAEYLLRWRGVRALPEQIIVTHGSQQALGLTARLLLDVGEYAAIEDPHYPGARLALRAAGAELIPVAVDEQGLDVAMLEQKRDRPRLVYVTPSHQFPTGVVLPLARRLALLRFAERFSAYIVEDDYDGEYRYGGSPLESLHGLDTAGRVIYVGTFSKILFPALRIGYVVVPPALVPVFARAKLAADLGNAQLEQCVLAQFISEGHLDTHLRRSRRRHAVRRRALLEALSQILPDRIKILGSNAGLHVLIGLRGKRPAQVPEIIARAREHDVGVYSTELCYDQRRPPCAELLLGHGSLSEDEIREGVRRLGDVLRLSAFRSSSLITNRREQPSYTTELARNSRSRR
jgi:GntR family transcriptional regulator/MocR family aminotransferase